MLQMYNVFFTPVTAKVKLSLIIMIEWLLNAQMFSESKSSEPLTCYDSYDIGLILIAIKFHIMPLYF